MTGPYIFKHPFKQTAAGCLDALGGLYRRFSPLPEKPFDRTAVKKILLIRLDHLGDVIMVRPAIDAVLSQFPNATVDFLVSAELAVLFAGEPRLNLIPVTHHAFSRNSSWIEQIREMVDLIPKLRHEHYDLGIDFRGDLRHILLMVLAGIPERAGFGITGGGFLLTRLGEYDPKLHQVDLNIKLLSGLGLDASPQRRPFISRTQKDWFKSSRGIRVVIHPGAGYPSKKWPVENYRALMDALFTQYPSAHVVLIGTREEQNRFPVLEREKFLTDLRGKTKIEDLPALFENAQLYIGNDSGPAHLAAVQGMDGIILFSGTNDFAVWRPWSEKFQIIRHEVPCSPCEAQICPLVHHDCMKKMEVSQVLAAVETHLRKYEQAHRS